MTNVNKMIYFAKACFFLSVLYELNYGLCCFERFDAIKVPLALVGLRHIHRIDLKSIHSTFNAYCYMQDMIMPVLMLHKVL